MEKINSYLGLAQNDYYFAKAFLPAGDTVNNYNMIASLCAQSAEKYLKAVIEKCFAEDESCMMLLHSHNLRSIYNKIVTRFDMTVTSKDCKWLGDFYFDARYPGDNFVEVNRQDAVECLRITEIISNDVSVILDQEEKRRQAMREAVKDLRAFE